MKWLLFLIALALAPLQTVPAGNGSISGIVIQAGTDRPIDGVQIVITRMSPTPGTPPQNQAGAYTDQYGRFEVADLAPGRYRIEWKRTGYFTPPVGTADPDESIIRSLIAQLGTDDLAIASPPAATSVTVELGPQEKSGGFVFRLIPGGVISGRVLDARGNPLVNATLTALRLNYEEGRRVLRPGGDSVKSDDRGNYRLFGLRPGEYYIRAELRLASAEVVRAYFPGVNSVTAAVPIAVNENGESPGASFSIPAVGTAKISGNVVGIPDSTRSSTSFYLLPDEMTGLEDPDTRLTPNSRTSTANRTTGEFELRGVAPGNYKLFATTFDSAQMRTYTGHVSISVGTQDLNNVSIEIHPDADLSGRLVLEDGSPVRGMLSLAFRNIEGTLGQTPSGTPTKTDGTFTLLRLREARYSMTTPNDTNRCVVDILQDGKSVYDEGFLGGNDTAAIDVVLGNACGTVQVQVIDDKKQPVAHAFVSLVPAMEHRRNLQLFRRAIFDVAASRYPPIKLIPPGEYKLFAWDNIPPNAELNAEYLARFEDRGVPVTVQRGASLTIPVTLISTRN